MKSFFKKKSNILIICLLWISTGFISSAVVTPGMDELCRGNNKFCFDLYDQLIKENKGNIFFSPYSISTALAMTYAGARGVTEKEMAKVLHFTLSREKLHSAFFELSSLMKEIQEKGDVALSVANSLWIQKDFKLEKSFLKTTDKFYGAVPFLVDFVNDRENTRKRINLWVEEKTNEKIKNLIPGGVLDNLTRLVLTNAIYFKGNWITKFKKSQTKKMPFWIDLENKKDVDTMFLTHTFKYREKENLQVLEMPYTGEDLSMLVILPSKEYGIKNLEKELRNSTLQNWMSGLYRIKVKVYFPKFKMTSKFNMKKTFQAMGMGNAFSRNANFSGMSEKPLKISEIIHKAFVEVNEEGTEAAAATAVIMKRIVSVRPKPRIPEFRADHPFIFMIMERSTGSILFMGRIADPS